MITVITGTPGAGKTLYSIAKLLIPLIGTTSKGVRDDGSAYEVPRTIYTNINGLQVEHDLIGPGGDWVQGKTKEWDFLPLPDSTGQGLRDWHTWAKPGSVIVYDEFQRVWPPRPNGAPVPPDLQALDTHRHMGVDLILISQTPNNFDRHIAGLTGRHLHVRRFGATGVTIVYEWDHLSRSLMYSKAISKMPWRYDKKVFKLYKSAELHTKQPKRLPIVLPFIALAVAAAAYLIPTTIQRISESAKPQNLIDKAASSTSEALNLPSATSDSLAAESAPAYDYTQFIPRISSVPNSAPAYDDLRQVVSMPRVAGAICNSRRCICYTEQATDTGMSDEECRTWSASVPYDPYTDRSATYQSAALPQHQVGSPYPAFTPTADTTR